MEEAKMNGKANVLLYFICETQILKYYRELLGDMKGEKC